MQLNSIDHIHINVQDRALAEAWYAKVLKLSRVSSLAFWATDGGPLTLANESGSIHLALFENDAVQSTIIAFKVCARDFELWKTYLEGERVEVTLADHQVSWSLYFQDPDGNPFEITTYEYEAVKGQVIGN